MRYAETFTFIATPNALVDRLRAAIRVGVDAFYLRHFQSYVLPHDLIDRFGAQVLPHFEVGSTGVSRNWARGEEKPGS
jgi:hypothetical protein